MTTRMQVGTTDGEGKIWAVTGSETIKVAAEYEDYEQDLADTKIPICRPRFIYFKFENLRPNTPHWFYFDRRPVNEWINTSYSFEDYKTLPRKHPLKNPGDMFKSSNSFPDTATVRSSYSRLIRAAGSQTITLGGPTVQAGEPINTDENGTIEGLFFLQSNSTISFRTGNLILSCMDVSTYSRESALSIAECTYTAVGINDRYTMKTRLVKEAYSYDEPTYGWVPDPNYTPPSSGGGHNNGNGLFDAALGAAAAGMLALGPAGIVAGAAAGLAIGATKVVKKVAKGVGKVVKGVAKAVGKIFSFFG